MRVVKLMEEDPYIIMGSILQAIKMGATRFREIEEKTGFSANTITKYTHELEKRQLIKIRRDIDRRKYLYELNEARMDEINALINAYLEHVKETTINYLNLILKAIKLDEDTEKKLEEAYEALSHLVFSLS